MILSPITGGRRSPARWRRATISSLAALATAFTFLVGTSSASAADAQQADDFIVSDFQTGKPIDSMYRAARVFNGYALFTSIDANAYSYTIKLVASSRAEQYRSTLQAVATELNAAGVAQMSVAAGTFAPPTTTPPVHEIYFYTGSDSPCGVAGIAGCGGPYLLPRAGNTAIAVSGQAHILPVVDGYSAAYKRHVVAHEIGHALGLEHYDASYLGAVQMMHPSSYAASTYQAGDRAGFSYVGRDVKPIGAIDSVTVPAAGKARLVGWAYDPDQWNPPTVRVTADGATVAEQSANISRPDVNSAYGLNTSTRGFDITVNVPAGARQLCVSVQNYPRSSFAQISTCRWVTSSGAVSSSRIDGANRYATAVNVSKTGFPGTAPAVVVASGENFPDALAAGPVASRLGGPLLLTQASTLTAVTKAEITRLKPSKIIVAGGTAAVSDAVLNALKPLTTTVVRAGGADRYETSRKLVSTAFGSASTGFIASGDAFPDGLAAGAAAANLKAPMILVPATSNAPTTAAATQLKSLGATSVRVVGGPAAVNDASLNVVKASVSNTVRVSGANRYLTAVALSKNAFTASTPQVFIAHGMNFPDGLVTAPLAAKTASPLFLSTGSCVSRDVLAEMNRLGATKLTLIGGTSTLGANVANIVPCS